METTSLPSCQANVTFLLLSLILSFYLHYDRKYQEFQHGTLCSNLHYHPSQEQVEQFFKYETHFSNYMPLNYENSTLIIPFIPILSFIQIDYIYKTLTRKRYEWVSVFHGPRRI